MLRKRSNIIYAMHLYNGYTFWTSSSATTVGQSHIITTTAIIYIPIGLQYRPAYKKHYFGMTLKTLSRAAA